MRQHIISRFAKAKHFTICVCDRKCSACQEKGYSTVDIDIEIEDAIKSVDPVAYDYYYQALYDNSVEYANENNIPTDHLMTVEHIQWEYDLHRLGKALGSSNANTTNLNYDETPLDMFLRWVGLK